MLFVARNNIIYVVCSYKQHYFVVGSYKQLVLKENWYIETFDVGVYFPTWQVGKKYQGFFVTASRKKQYQHSNI